MKASSHLFRPRIILPAIGVVYILSCRLYPTVGEGYSRHIYPCLSRILSACSSIIPFSLEEIFIAFCCTLLLIYPIYAQRQRVGLLRILTRIAEGGVWIFIWFYLSWGNNYYRHDFFIRTQTRPQPYNKAEFQNFLIRYTDSLHACYTICPSVDKEKTSQIIHALYTTLPAAYGLCPPQEWQRPKLLLFNSLYSGVGVLGYMGPFFCEMQLNHDLLPRQYAFTYAHELSHLLGISNEAEANFWAYYICTRAKEKEIRASGYFNILPYVAANARQLLQEKDYQAWLSALHPDILKELEQQHQYWHSLYCPVIGEIQDYLYNFYLKGNRIPDGRKNYAEVISLILAFENHSRKPYR